MRCVLLTGAEGMFSSGYDLGDLGDEVFAEEAERLVAHPFTGAIEALDACPVPSVAALPGHTIGGGLELALACDLRLAADGIRLGMPPAKLGLVYSHTGLRRFVEAIGVPRTRELFLLGRNIDARTALGWGLVNAVALPTDVDEEALAWCEELAANSPLSVRGNKRVIRELVAADGRLDPDVERRAHRPAAQLLPLRGHPRGRPRLRREAAGALARAMNPAGRSVGRRIDRREGT